MTRIHGNRPQPDEFYPEAPPVELSPAMPMPSETPLPSAPGVPSSLPEQPLEAERLPIHPTPLPQVP